jgi:hypothetical protein
VCVSCRTEDGAEAGEDASDLSRGYDYLLSMKIWSLTLEKVRGAVATAMYARD